MKAKEAIRKLHHFVQRGRKGYSERDRWCFDLYLSQMLARYLREDVEKNVGYPGGNDPEGNKWTPESWDAFRLGLADDMDAWKDDNDFLNPEVFDRTKQAVIIFAENFGKWWD